MTQDDETKEPQVQGQPKLKSKLKATVGTLERP